jgi:hypothetical protein
MKTATKKTDEEIFLAWCKERGLKIAKAPREDRMFTNGGRPATDQGPRRFVGNHYNLDPDGIAVISCGGVEFKLNPDTRGEWRIDVYFTEHGDWSGGCNWIWNRGLPWQSDSRFRRKRSG